MMDITYRPYYHDPEIELLIEDINPPRVCIDNNTSPDCTLVKVDSTNKHGRLLEMVQVLTDLDLVISKSYINSDGGWLMDVFHVTDQLGNKVTDEGLIQSIQEGICANRRASKEDRPRNSRGFRPRHILTEQTALEMTGIDRPGLMSEMSAKLTELGCHVTSGVAWTHNKRVACIIYIEDSSEHGPITDLCRLAHIQAQLENVVEAHHYNDERRSVRLAGPAPGRTHTERRLHQLMEADKDYLECGSCCGCLNEDDEIYGYTKCTKVERKGSCDATHVRIENSKDTGYSIVNVRCTDRPKLLFDTVCTLTDLQYVVYHAAISSKGSIAFQEYYVKHKDGYSFISESDFQKVTQCLIAATERRISHGLRMDVCTKNRTGLLSDVTRVLRENGLSITRAEISNRGEKAIGTFYVKDTSGENVNEETLNILKKEIGGTIVVEKKCTDACSSRTSSNSSSSGSRLSDEEKSSLSLIGNLFWTQLERFSSNFKLVRS